MFLDEKMLGPRPEPRPERPHRRLSAREERVLLAILGFNILMLLAAPIGGATILQGLATLVRGH
ncbi:hypothetical protein J5J86_04280 [Aquabacter sp. L1I39]|uniref:hypothetical protein n=1 Tax=Aquabacter sp. L1I39 TaxID=2820278 RepID=UPI001ADD1C29|nr:hypothetical protein [Aquabacter sp. L1I39]QTL04561.1 hypothetical protein J5J86_04280 [Aquabacter sp. L1I39]